MNPIEAAQRIGEILDEDGLAYGIGGALALGVWGAPRATKDVDLSVFVGRDELARVIDSLERAGVLLARDEVAREVERIGLFVGRLGKIRVDVFISQHPQFVAMAHRVQRVVAENGWSGAFLSMEDVVL